MSTLVGHFVSSPGEREKKDRRDRTGDEREGNRKMNESEETRNKNIPPEETLCMKCQSIFW